MTPVHGLHDFGGSLTVSVGAKVISGDTAHHGHNSLVLQVDGDPEESEEKGNSEPFLLSVKGEIFALSGNIHLWSWWFDFTGGSNAEEDRDAAEGEKELRKEGADTDKDDSLGGNEEISCSVNDGNSLLEWGPVAPKHKVKEQANDDKNCSTDEHSSSCVFLFHLEALEETESSTNNIDELHEDDCGISDGSWISTHHIHVEEGIDHSKNKADDNIEPWVAEVLNHFSGFTFLQMVKEFFDVILKALWYLRRIFNDTHAEDVFGSKDI